MPQRRPAAAIAVASIVSIPMSVYTSRATLGVRARRAGLFLIPEETNPPPEILATQQYVRETAGVPDHARSWLG